ncbi:iron uptake porin [Pseudanabaena mucicola]|uniref:iron uptake porin n=1 Tax=Pseudanabaena mucicola TaxID=71190 RepID=UPI002578020A|nr:iron uptake porin [Pseudanabaena mucicola]
MSKLNRKQIRKNSFLAPAVITATVAASTLLSSSANAETKKFNIQSDRSATNSDVIRSENSSKLVGQLQLLPNAVSQNVTSVSQLSDVRSTDWAFTALQSLVERYGVIAGYPDRTFRGRQALTRYEFAAGLNSALDKINEIISAGLADKVSKEDLATLQKLQEEFAAELATLRGRVDALDAKVTKLEAQQFSTTTKLRGEAIFGLAAATDGVGATTDKTNLVFQYRTRLNFDTSFTGKDLLRTRLQATNANTNGRIDTGGTTPFSGLGVANASRLSYETGVTSNTFELNRLFYRFPIGDSFTAYIAPLGQTEDVINPLNPLESDSQGTISRFGRYSPLNRIASGGGTSGLAVAGFDWKFTKDANLQVAYSSSNAAAATGQGGVTGADTKIAAQLVYKPTEALTLGVGYANAYTVNNSLGSGLNAEFLPNATNTALASPGVSGIQSNTVVGNLVWDITKKFSFTTWGAFVFANSTGATTASATFTSWNATLAGKDLFSEGDLAALSFGQPLFTSSVGGVAVASPSTPYQLEALYRFRVSKNITITPGVFFVFNQGSNSANGTATVGVIRTTFTF